MSDEAITTVKKWTAEIVKWALTSLVAICVWFASQIKEEVTQTRKALNTLTLKAARLDWHEQRLADLKVRLTELEKRLRDLEKGN